MTNTDRPARPQETRTRAGGPSLDTIAQLITENRVADAIATCRALLRSEPSNIAALEVLARAQWALGKYEDVLQTSSNLLRRHPTEPGYRLLQAMAYQAMGKFGTAVQFVRRCIDESTVPSVTRRAEEMLIDLEDIQSRVIAGLCRDDHEFAVEYSSDPQGACRSRGFEMSWFDDEHVAAPDVPVPDPWTVFIGRA